MSTGSGSSPTPKPARPPKPSSIGNLKRVWTAKGHTLDWQSETVSGDYFLRRAIEVKNVWVPYGD